MVNPTHHVWRGDDDLDLQYRSLGVGVYHRVVGVSPAVPVGVLGRRLDTNARRVSLRKGIYLKAYSSRRVVIRKIYNVWQIQFSQVVPWSIGDLHTYRIFDALSSDITNVNILRCFCFLYGTLPATTRVVYPPYGIQFARLCVNQFSRHTWGIVLYGLLKMVLTCSGSPQIPCRTEIVSLSR